jgi:hypothetical protein
VVSFTPQPLYSQGKIPWYPLDRRLGGPQRRFGRGGEEKNSQPPPSIEPQNPDRPARSPALYRLSYHSSLLNIIYKYKDADIKLIKFWRINGAMQRKLNIIIKHIQINHNKSTARIVTSYGSHVC